MVDALQSIGDKIVAAIVAASALASGLLAVVQTTVAPSPSQNTASESVQEPVAVIQATRATTSPLETSGSLPIVVLLPRKATAVTKTKASSTAHIPAATAPVITAQWLLDNIKISFKQKRDGAYKAAFTAKTGGKDLVWGTEDAFIGGAAGIPRFAFSFSCDPPLEAPPPDSPDQAMFFKVRTSYDCAIGLTATSGNDQRVRSKNPHLETGAGQLVVAPPSAMNTVLANGTNNGGFVFTNQDTKQVTVTKLVLDLSYTALSNLNGPLVLRITDPSSDTPLFEYHMEDLAADPANTYTRSATGVGVPLRFTLGPSSQKLLPIQLLGAHTMSISGIDPKAVITLRAITIDSDEVPAVLSAPQIQWSCVVALGAYDPNATSGPFATGVACR